jgi:predicted O-methyltransferase YrrM
MKRYVNRLPLIGPLARSGYHLAYRALKSASDRSALQSLSHSNYPQARALAHVLHQLTGSVPQDELALIARIEDERQRLLRQDRPLIDGSLGEAGLYDRDVTIKAACEASKPPKPSLLLYLLIRTFKPLNVIELGTNVGISSAYQAMALQRNGQNGKLTTLEASPYRLRLAKELHKNLGLENVTYVAGLFSETLNKVLDNINAVDFAFIDGNHKYQPTLDYYNAVLSHTANSAIFIFDDIRWSYGMKQAWSKIQEDDRMEMSIDLHSMGLCIGLQEPPAKRYQYPPIHCILF